MPTEKRTRVEIFLPIRSDLTAYQTALEWLAEELAFIRGGSTYTTPVTGLYASSTRIDIVQDSVRILFCEFDTNLEIDDERLRLVNYLERVKQFLIKSLEEEEVWIVYHPITRIVS
jgi:hypothetical protein